MKLTTEIKITDVAKNYLSSISNGATGLRLSIRGGKGCGGNEYDLKPLTESEIDAGDDFISLNETCNLYIPPMDMIKLFGTEIDYIEDDLGNRRIHISNPNETGKCGCGKSVTF
ncbi:MAG TPA: iron-sulfur cluster assembly accessory protein [Rhodospirillaceae bacterium]|nr:iron-sulfur cluster assembly accessory protein [Rhodospirillaceae bacterium]